MNKSYQLSPTVRSVEDAEGITLLDLQGGKYFSVTGVGADIWRALEEEHSSEQIVDRLAASYGAPAERISQDLDQFTAQLEKRGLIHARRAN